MMRYGNPYDEKKKGDFESKGGQIILLHVFSRISRPFHEIFTGPNTNIARRKYAFGRRRVE